MNYFYVSLFGGSIPFAPCEPIDYHTLGGGKSKPKKPPAKPGYIDKPGQGTWSLLENALSGMLKVSRINGRLLRNIPGRHTMTSPNTPWMILNGEWNLSYGPQSPTAEAPSIGQPPRGFQRIAASVPGNVELDLERAAVIEDPSVGNRIYELRKYETYEWWYERSFDAKAIPADHRVELVFEGLDCLGTVWLNGKLLGSTDNMLIPHRFDVTRELNQAGRNELVVRIGSAVLEGRKRVPEAVEWAQSLTWEANHVRKAPHMYGWDIAPRIVSSGLWRDVLLELVPPTRWRSVYWTTRKVDPEDGNAHAVVMWDFTTDRTDIDDLKVRVTVYDGEKTVHAAEQPAVTTHGVVNLKLKDIEFWWPRGYGDPALYDGLIELVDDTGTVLCERRTRVGFRTVSLRRTDVTEPDKPGEFVFLINGEKVFAKGTNWVPLDAFHSRDPLHLKPAVEMLVDLNCNMVRCWGGNVYEDHAFFDLCDEHGIMVWQDFAMACALYPQTDDFAGRVQREAEVIVERLRNHPSLVLWAGNNENDVFSLGKAPEMDPNDDRISRRVLPDVVRRLDPFRPYLPSSPYVGPEVMKKGSEKRLLPEDHLWGPRDDFKGPFYVESPAHFVSEIGYHGCPDRLSLEEMFDPDHLWPWQDNDQWLTKCVRPLRSFKNCDYRIPLMAKQAGFLFGTVPEDLDDFILASQISQAEALKFFVERWRAGKWRRTGILWWNLRDCWPIISDAIVDYYNRPKLAYGYIKRCQTDICAICGEPESGRHEIVVVNDTRKATEGQVTISDVDSGKSIFAARLSVSANGGSVAGQVAETDQPSMWKIECAVEGAGVLRNHYLAGPRPFSLEDYKRWLKALELKQHGIESIGAVR